MNIKLSNPRGIGGDNLKVLLICEIVSPDWKQSGFTHFAIVEYGSCGEMARIQINLKTKQVYIRNFVDKKDLSRAKKTGYFCESHCCKGKRVQLPPRGFTAKATYSAHMIDER